jgi:hypothetical protein
MTQTTSSSKVLAYLLALQDFSETSDVLSDQEKANLKKVAKDLSIQRKALKSHIEPLLTQTIEINPLLHQSFQYYKGRLNELEQIPNELLPQYAEVKTLVTNQSNFATKGFDDNSLPTGVDQQIENALIVVGQSESPEQTVKKLSSIGKLKQFLRKPTQHS